MKSEKMNLTAKISGGNSKLGNLPNFSLAPGKTCSADACKTCYSGGCYAQKFYRLYKTVKEAWDINTGLALNNLEQLEGDLMHYFSAITAPRFFRIHTGGDFVTSEYAKMWARVAAANPHTNFLAFTKQWDNVRGIEFPDNFSLVLSAWKGCDIPADLLKLYPVAYCCDTVEEIEATGAIECPGNCSNCGVCWALAKRHENVAFLKH